MLIWFHVNNIYSTQQGHNLRQILISFTNYFRSNFALTARDSASVEMGVYNTDTYDIFVIVTLREIRITYNVFHVLQVWWGTCNHADRTNTSAALSYILAKQLFCCSVRIISTQQVQFVCAKGFIIRSVFVAQSTINKRFPRLNEHIKCWT